MEITQDQFTANLEQMPEGAQVQVVQLIEQNEPPVLQAFVARRVSHAGPDATVSPW